MVIGEFTYNRDKVNLFEYNRHYHLVYQKFMVYFYGINISFFYDYNVIYGSYSEHGEIHFFIFFYKQQINYPRICAGFLPS
mgnify:CR=1 FL=1